MYQCTYTDPCDCPEPSHDSNPHTLKCNSEENTGLVHFFVFKVQDFFHTFSNHFFLWLKVLTQVTLLEPSHPNEAMMHSERTLTAMHKHTIIRSGGRVGRVLKILRLNILAKTKFTWNSISWVRFHLVWKVSGWILCFSSRGWIESTEIDACLLRQAEHRLTYLGVRTGCQNAKREKTQHWASCGSKHGCTHLTRIKK